MRFFICRPDPLRTTSEFQIFSFAAFTAHFVMQPLGWEGSHFTKRPFSEMQNPVLAVSAMHLSAATNFFAFSFDALDDLSPTQHS